MARSTYISENLTSDQIDLLKLLDDFEIEYFSLQEIEGQIGKRVPNLNEVVENLAAKGLLDRIERGKYTRPNFKDPNVLGTFIAPGKAAVAYWSALHLHGLSDRFPDRVIIKTVRRKTAKRIFGVQYQFVFVRPEKFTGNTTHGYGNQSYPITDQEMTIVDCFDQPRYGGALPDLLKAVSMAQLDVQKLIEYTRVTGNISVIKRLGFLVELLQKHSLESFVEFALSQVNPRYVLFDPFGPEQGEFNNRWKLRMNLPQADIFAIIQSPY